MSSSVTGPLTFNGSSTYASSFQSVLQRAVAIASLPLTQMQNNINDYQSQGAAVASLQGTFGSLQNSINNIAAAAGGSVAASSSNSTIAVGSATAGTLPGIYQLDVESIGSSTSTISDPANTVVTDPTTTSISTSLNYKLIVNGGEHDFTVKDHSLQSLAAAINGSGTGVQATIVNLGSNGSPDYRLSVSSTNLGADTVQLNDGATNLLDNLQTGSLAQYKVNGNSTVLTSTTNHVTLAPGLTATLVSSAPGQNVNITVATSETALSSSLNDLASAYNSAVDALAQQRGQSGGALSGQGVILSLQQTLSQVLQFQGSSGPVKTLDDLGLSIDSTGHMSFDATKLNNLSTADVQQFLGTATTSGFLKTAGAALSSVADPTDGLLTTQLTSLSNEVTSITAQMTSQQVRIDTLQTSLQAQLAAADAAIAVLQQQKTFFADMFAAQYLSNNTSSGSSTIG